MPEFAKPAPAPVQLPLFPKEASLARIRPERNQWRYYRLAVCPPPAIPSGCAGRNLGPAPPDLFGHILLARQCGRIGTPGGVRLDPIPTEARP